VNNNKKAIVIGAGIGGIATAIRLANKGYKVQVFEANSYPGGKLSEFELNGFRFDAGPSLFTLPHLVDELFTLSGKNPADYFTYKQLSVVCHYFYEDGTFFKAFSDKNKFVDEANRVFNEPKQHIEKHLAQSRKIYQITSEIFMFNSLHKISNFLNLRTLQSLLRIHQIHPLKKMHEVNAKNFQNEKLVQLFNRYATYNGSDPYKAPATLNIIPHLEHHFGAYIPDGGMFSITNSLVKLATDLGVTFHFNKKVDEIIVEKNTAKGIKIGEESFFSELLVSNMDVYFTYNKLLKHTSKQHISLSQPRSSSALIFYWGINKQFENLDLHNIFFSANYKAEFEHIFDKKTIFNDPTVYINITSKYIKTDAPEGTENWFVMINVPHNDSQNWDDLIKEARKNIIEKLNRLLKTDLEKLIVCEQVLEPRTIESKTASYLGALYGNSSNTAMSAFLRHPNFISDFKNLYFCGGSVHPGGGIPLALSSAKIIDKLLNE
jgi:phytoene desaturase